MPGMRAALFDEYGPSEVLYEGTVPAPRTGPEQLLVRVRAVTVNGGELILRAGRLPKWFARGPFPRQTGLDFVGEIAEVGSAVTGHPVRPPVGDYAVGDPVWGVLDERPDENGQMLRSLADYVAVAPAQVSRAPATLSPTEAVTLPVGGLTALLALRRKTALRPGNKLLVRGASGGVGSAAVQLGTAFGAHVTGLAGAKNLDFVTALGAHDVHDYRSTRPEQLGPFDVVLDAVGTQLPRYRRRVAAGGRMLAASFDTDHLLRSLAGIAVSTVHGRERIRFFRGSPEHDLLAELARMADDGTLVPVVDEVFPLSRVARAHRRSEQGGVRGKVVITVD